MVGLKLNHVSKRGPSKLNNRLWNMRNIHTVLTSSYFVVVGTGGFNPKPSVLLHMLGRSYYRSSMIDPVQLKQTLADNGKRVILVEYENIL